MSNINVFETPREGVLRILAERRAQEAREKDIVGLHKGVPSIGVNSTPPTLKVFPGRYDLDPGSVRIMNFVLVGSALALLYRFSQWLLA